MLKRDQTKSEIQISSLMGRTALLPVISNVSEQNVKKHGKCTNVCTVMLMCQHNGIVLRPKCH